MVNTNIARPPVSPVGLEYVAEALLEAGLPVSVLDLSFEADWKEALRSALAADEPVAVGLTVRNTDDCCFATRSSFLPWIREVVAEVKEITKLPVFLGGVGFSTLPQATLTITQADFGIEGDGEEIATAVVHCLRKRQDPRHLPNVVYRQDGRVNRNPRVDVDLRHLPLPRRRLFAKQRYEQLVGMVGVETKRGCPGRCIFCADPVAKGARVRLRPPHMVAAELKDLLEQGVSWFYLCDSEFNLPLGHAKEVCQALIKKGLADRIRWYTYCSPTPFDAELARLMKRAGCAGINFGVDSLSQEQLQRLGRSHSPEDVYELVQLLSREGMNYMFDFLLGGPGETPETVKTTIEKVREWDVPLAGIAAGVRVYPGTPLAEAIASGALREGLHPKAVENPAQPLFYLSPYLGQDVSTLIGELVGGDPRFLVLAEPGGAGSYNYAGAGKLSQLIQRGARGAYWDILRQAT